MIKTTITATASPIRTHFQMLLLGGDAINTLGGDAITTLGGDPMVALMIPFF